MKGLGEFSDTELVYAINQNDQLNSAILFIYKQYAAPISSFIMGYGGTSQDGEDIFQEAVVTFIDLVKKGKFRSEATVKTFLTAIARNIWLNELNKKQRTGIRERLYENRREANEPDVSHHLDERELKNQLRDILEKLGDPCKKILMMFYYENLSMKEMVNYLNYENEQVVRNKKYKCLQQLTKLLSDKPEIARQLIKKD
jgi:RNA polymerase sigma factor (sigma-70 family)